jgi:hypothetical protein
LTFATLLSVILQCSSFAAARGRRWVRVGKEGWLLLCACQATRPEGERKDLTPCKSFGSASSPETSSAAHPMLCALCALTPRLGGQQQRHPGATHAAKRNLQLCDPPLIKPNQIYSAQQGNHLILSVVMLSPRPPATQAGTAGTRQAGNRCFSPPQLLLPIQPHTAPGDCPDCQNNDARLRQSAGLGRPLLKEERSTTHNTSHNVSTRRNASSPGMG